jgi:hypothetical protein
MDKSSGSLFAPISSPDSMFDTSYKTSNPLFLLRTFLNLPVIPDTELNLSQTCQTISMLVVKGSP